MYDFIRAKGFVNSAFFYDKTFCHSAGHCQSLNIVHCPAITFSMIDIAYENSTVYTDRPAIERPATRFIDNDISCLIL